MRHLILLTVLLLVSCKKEKETYSINAPTVEEHIVTDTLENESEKIEDFADFKFPQTGKTPKDFIKNSNYEILEEIKGHLNDDKFEDIALIIRDKNDKQSGRTILVLTNNGIPYNLFATNDIILGAEYSSDNYKINDSEEIKIESKTLFIDTFCTGPCGNRWLEFSINDGSLKLKMYKSYNIGAGLFRLSRFAGYVRDNMPFKQASHTDPQITNEEAWDVAAYVNSQPRPFRDLSKDWPDISKKPIDHPFGPYSDGFTEQQHKYGPFIPIIEARKKISESK